MPGQIYPQLALFEETPPEPAKILTNTAQSRKKLDKTVVPPSPAALAEKTIADIVSRASLLDPSALVVQIALQTRPKTVERWVREFALGADGDTAAQRFCNHILVGIASNRPEVGDRRAELAKPWVPLFLRVLDDGTRWEPRENSQKEQ